MSITETVQCDHPLCYSREPLASPPRSGQPRRLPEGWRAVKGKEGVRHYCRLHQFEAQAYADEARAGIIPRSPKTRLDLLDVCHRLARGQSWREIAVAHGYAPSSGGLVADQGRGLFRRWTRQMGKGQPFDPRLWPWATTDELMAYVGGKPIPHPAAGQMLPQKNPCDGSQYDWLVVCRHCQSTTTSSRFRHEVAVEELRAWGWYDNTRIDDPGFGDDDEWGQWHCPLHGKETT